ENNNVAEVLNASKPETDISSNSKHSVNKEIGVCNRDNVLSYHDVLLTRSSANYILAFYFLVAKANSYSAYCQFVQIEEIQGM
ncbi:28706_t:CDS:1, partial [Gigaspora margarita]